MLVMSIFLWRTGGTVLNLICWLPFVGKGWPLDGRRWYCWVGQWYVIPISCQYKPPMQVLTGGLWAPSFGGRGGRKVLEMGLPSISVATSYRLPHSNHRPISASLSSVTVFVELRLITDGRTGGIGLAKAAKNTTRTSLLAWLLTWGGNNPLQSPCTFLAFGDVDPLMFIDYSAYSHRAVTIVTVAWFLLSRGRQQLLLLIVMCKSFNLLERDV